MKIKIKKTKEVEVELSNKQMSKIAIEVIKRVYNLPKEELYIKFVNDQKFLCYDEEVYTSHKFDIRHIIKLATPEDDFLLELIDKLKEYK